MSDVRIQGEHQLAEHLKATAVVLDQPPGRQVLSLILQAARQRAPVRTGNLRASGDVGPGRITFTVPYAAPIHWGWPARNIEPNPFLIKGITATEDRWMGLYADTINEAIQ